MGLVLSILVALLWSLFDVIRKKSVKLISEIKVLLIIVISQSIFFLIFLLFSDFFLVLSSYFFLAILLIFLNFISMYLFLKVLKSGAISTFIPMLSFTPLFSALYSNLILNETLLYIQYLGMVFILIGTFLLHANNKKISNVIKSPWIILEYRNFFLIILVALIWSLTPVLDKKSLQYCDLYLHGFIQSIGMLLILPFFFKENLFKEIKFLSNKVIKNYLLYFLIIISFICSFLQLITLKFIFVAELEALKRSIGIIMSLFFGYYYFHEKINYMKIFSVFLILIGVINIAIFT